MCGLLDRKPRSEPSGEMMTDDSKNRLSTLTDQDAAPEASPADAGPEPVADDDVKRNPGVDVQAYIGRQLRAVYDDVAKQPVPERFLDLMKQLEGVKPRG